MILLNRRSLLTDFFSKFFFLLIISPSILFGQEKSLYNPDLKGFNIFLEDGKELITSPLHWESSDWLTFSGIVGGTLLTSTIDMKIKDIVMANNYKFNLPMKIGKWTGEPIATFSIASGFYLYGTAFNNNSAKRIGFEVAESFFYAGTIDFLLKISLGRYRPYANKGNGSFQPFSILNYSTHSFPSGHSTVAFSLSTILASHTENYLLKILIYTPAILTLTQRVYENQHWTSDVFTGAALGFLIGKFIVNQHNSTDDEKFKCNLYLTPNGNIGFLIRL